MSHRSLLPLILADEAAAVRLHEASKAWGDAVHARAAAVSYGYGTPAHAEAVVETRGLMEAAAREVGTCRADLQLAFAELVGKVETGAGGATLPPEEVCVHGHPYQHAADDCPECYAEWCDREMAADLARDSLVVDRDEAHESDRASYSEAVGSGRK